MGEWNRTDLILVILIIVIMVTAYFGYLYIEGMQSWIEREMLRAENLWKMMCYK
tara:strand:+ start:916 stop:1077 length:162 start_codon:yes stop_codon:yes gene_type:complete